LFVTYTKRIKHKTQQAKQTFRNWYKNYARWNASAGKIFYSKVAFVIRSIRRFM